MKREIGFVMKKFYAETDGSTAINMIAITFIVTTKILLCVMDMFLSAKRSYEGRS